MVRDKKFHRVTSITYEKDWRNPDFSNFDPKMFWEAR